MQDYVRTVDLFCGCGGLALGFDLYDGPPRFKTVLGADNDPSVLRIFNNNFSEPGQKIPTGRRTDLDWFAHRSEVLLYYLAHLALLEGDEHLLSILSELGYPTFLRRLRVVDRVFSLQTADLWEREDFRRAWVQVEGSTTTLALYKGVMARLGLSSFGPPVPSDSDLPWTQEYRLLEDELDPPVCWNPHEAIAEATEQIWDTEIARFRDSVSKEGRGQHRTVASRMAGLVRFIDSAAGHALRDLWLTWKSTRHSIRASFCLDVESELEEIYEDGRQIGLVLGGPPCKGWSRIGRAVIEDLREQGVHAWASSKFGDERNSLLYKYALVLDALRPAAFLFENVAHFSSSLRTPSGLVHAATILEEAIEELSRDHIHYDVASRIVRSRRYCVPQDRDRFILVGIRGDRSASGGAERFFSGLTAMSEEVPLSTALAGLSDPAVFDPYDRDVDTGHETSAYTLLDPRMPPSQRRYIEWIRQPHPKTGDAPTTADAHVVRKPRSDDAAFYEYLAPGKRWMDYKFTGMPTLALLRTALEHAAGLNGQGEGADLIRDALETLDDSLVLRLLLEALPPTTQDERHHLLKGTYLAKGTDNHGDWLERLSPDAPCKTIVAHIGKDTYGYIHPTQPRALSMREAARVQSFPDFFSLKGSGVVDTYSTIGNAVPPLLAHHFAERLGEIHERDGIFPVVGTNGTEADAHLPQLTLAPLAAAEGFRKSRSSPRRLPVPSRRRRAEGRPG